MKVLLFGLIAEKAGSDHMEIPATSTADLDRQLQDRIRGLKGLSYSIAIDRTIVHGDRALSGSEEIAVLPPFAGG